jgi:hypothetical protein
MSMSGKSSQSLSGLDSDDRIRGKPGSDHRMFPGYYFSPGREIGKGKNPFSPDDIEIWFRRTL